jgi:hypothetical protein
VKKIAKRLTYANVMSSIAVFLVLGGATALAAGLAKNSVGSKQIKKNAVTTAKIKNGAVTTSKIKNGAITGAQVNASTLGTVPNATHAGSADTAKNADNANHAGSADNANNANAVGGLHLAKLNYSSNLNGSKTVIFSGAGLTLYAACDADEDLDFTATTDVNNSEIYESGNYLTTYEGNYDDNFDQGDTENVGANIGDNSQDEVQGQLVYANPNGGTVTAEFFLNDNESFGGITACAVQGTVTFS